MSRAAFLVAVTMAGSACVYFNAVYDVRQTYSEAVDLQRDGDEVTSRVRFDSVIAMTQRIMADHPQSKHAASAAILRARAQIARGFFEAAASTAASVGAYPATKGDLDTAAGLRGVALQQSGENLRSDSILSTVIDGEVSDDDRALFLFHRGLARLDSGDPAGAGEDLAAAGVQGGLSGAGRLDLARALSDVGQYHASARLTIEMVRANRFANFGTPLLAHLDSLAERAPVLMDSMLAAELETPDQPDTKRAALYYYRGRSRSRLDDTVAALAMYDSARAGAARSRYGTAASFLSAQIRLRWATEPAHIVETLGALETAGGTADPDYMVEALRLRERVRLFANLVSAVDSRGSSAAEAALRAAEIAGGDLAVPGVARGLYLRYLELAPDSPWAAKAMYGALLYAGSPATGWVEDRGAGTDARLRDMLVSLPAGNPYRVSMADLARDSDADSAYVSAEEDLHRRLLEIRMLYDTTTVLLQPEDAPPEEPRRPPAGEEGEGDVF